MKWIITLTVGISALALGILFAIIGVEQADKLASVIGAFIGLSGLAISIWSVTGGQNVPAAPLPAQHSGSREVSASPSQESNGSADQPELLWTARKLPIRNPDFVGRSALLVKVHSCLHTQHNVVALRGQGGIGKSAMAQEYAHRFSDRYDVVWWVDAGRPEFIGGQLRELAHEVGIVGREMSTIAAVNALMRELRRRDRWLLILDNAMFSDTLADYFSGIRGHLLITTRDSTWSETAVHVDVTLFNREESVELLTRNVSGITPAAAGELSEAHGDLPLALVQASRNLVDSRIPVEEYLHLLPDHAAELMDGSGPGTYPTSLATSVRVGLKSLTDENEIAGRALRIRSFLASEPTPAAWFVPVVADNAWQVGKIFDAIRRTSPAHLDEEGLVLHELIGSIVKGQCSEKEKQECEAAAVDVLLGAQPEEATDPANWSAWARITPHIVALRPGTTTRQDLRRLACECGRYLLESGQVRSALSLIGPMRQSWQARLGPDHEITLTATHLVANVYREQGNAEEARRLDTDTLSRRRRLLGSNHPDTLRTANNLANDLALLGKPKQSRRLNKEVLRRRGRVLGPAHPETLASMVNLADDLGELGRHTQARALNEQALSAYDRLLGERHPRTLIAAANLADSLSALGELEAARALGARTLERMRALWGLDHPHTLYVTAGLARNLRALGKEDEALALEEETRQ